MEKSNQRPFLRSLAMGFGNGLLVGMAVKLVQKAAKRKEEQVAGPGRLAERLINMEDYDRQVQTIDREAPAKNGDSFDRRVLDKIIAALEARLAEHVGHVDRRIAEMDAQVSLDLKAVLNHTASQNSAFERAVQQIESEVRSSAEAAQRQGAEQISGVEQKLTALQEALPAKFREIVEAVRQAMEARLALELQALATPTQDALQQIEAGDKRMASIAEEVRESMEGVAQLREALSAVNARFESGDQRAAEQANDLEHRFTILQEELSPRFKAVLDSVRQSIDSRIAEELKTPVLEEGVAQLREAMGAVNARLESDDQRASALDRKLSLLQEELPPKFKAIVDAMREALDSRLAAELQILEEQHHTHLQAVEARLHDEIRAIEETTLAGAAELEKALQYSSTLEARIRTLEQMPQPSSDETVVRAVESVWQSLESRLLQRTEPAQTPESIVELRKRSASAEQSVVDLIASLGQILRKACGARRSPCAAERGGGNGAWRTDCIWYRRTRSPTSLRPGPRNPGASGVFLLSRPRPEPGD